MRGFEKLGFYAELSISAINSQHSKSTRKLSAQNRNQ